MAILVQVRVSEDGSSEAFGCPVRTAVGTLRRERPEEFAQLGGGPRYCTVFVSSGIRLGKHPRQ